MTRWRGCCAASETMVLKLPSRGSSEQLPAKPWHLSRRVPRQLRVYSLFLGWYRGIGEQGLNRTAGTESKLGGQLVPGVLWLIKCHHGSCLGRFHARCTTYVAALASTWRIGIYYARPWYATFHWLRHLSRSSPPTSVAVGTYLM